MVCVFFAFVWSLLGTAEVQSWNTYWESSANNDKTIEMKRKTDQVDITERKVNAHLE